MIMSSNGNIFCVTGPLWGEYPGHRWNSLKKARDAELWCFLWSAPEQTPEQTVETLVIWDAIALIIMTLLQWNKTKRAPCAYFLKRTVHESRTQRHWLQQPIGFNMFLIVWTWNGLKHVYKMNWLTKTTPAILTLLIESVKTTSMWNESTEVLCSRLGRHAFIKFS